MKPKNKSQKVTVTKRRGHDPIRDSNLIDDDPMDGTKGAPMKGEKLRQAARQRRDQEAELYKELSELLPYEKAVTRRLNNSDIMRLVVSYIQMKNYALQGGSSNLDNLTKMITEGEKNNGKKVLWENSEAALSLGAVDSFLIVVNLQNRIVFTSENVVDYLGFKQIELIGMNVLDYISEEQQDFFGEIMKEDMADQIAGNKCKCMTDDDETEIDCNKCSGDCCEQLLAVQRKFQLNMRRRLTRKMRRRKEDPYQTFQWMGRLQYIMSQDQTDDDKPKYSVKPYSSQLSGFIGLCRPVGNMAITEISTVGSTFMLKINFDLKLVAVDESIRHIMGFEPKELLNKSLWDLWHPDDATYRHCCQKSGCALSCPGQSKAKKDSILFRIKNKNDSWVWVESRICKASREEKRLMTINKVVSEERGGEYLDALKVDCKKSQIAANCHAGTPPPIEVTEEQKALCTVSLSPEMFDPNAPLKVEEPEPEYLMQPLLTDSDFEVGLMMTNMIDVPEVVEPDDSGRKSADLVDTWLSDISTLKGPEVLGFLDSMEVPSTSSTSVEMNQTQTVITTVEIGPPAIAVGSVISVGHGAISSIGITPQVMSDSAILDLVTSTDSNTAPSDTMSLLNSAVTLPISSSNDIHIAKLEHTLSIDSDMHTTISSSDLQSTISSSDLQSALSNPDMHETLSSSSLLTSAATGNMSPSEFSPTVMPTNFSLGSHLESTGSPPQQFLGVTSIQTDASLADTDLGDVKFCLDSTQLDLLGDTLQSSLDPRTDLQTIDSSLIQPSPAPPSNRLSMDSISTNISHYGLSPEPVSLSSDSIYHDSLQSSESNSGLHDENLNCDPLILSPNGLPMLENNVLQIDDFNLEEFLPANIGSVTCQDKHMELRISDYNG